MKLTDTTLSDLRTTLDQSGRVATLTLMPTLASVAGSKLRGAIGLRSTWFDVSSLALQQPTPSAPIAYGSSVTLTGWARGVTGVSLEQRSSGGSWHLVGPVTAAADGSVLLPEAPTLTTDYRLATPAAAVGYVRVRVMPAVSLSASPSPGEIAGSERPALPGAAVAVQAQSPDLKWVTVARGAAASDGTFAVAAQLAAGTTYRVLVTPGHGYSPGATAPQVAAG